MQQNTDHGPDPYVVNIEEVTVQNTHFRQALWTGRHLQLTVMSLQPGEEIGLEVHDDHDQFLRVEAGQGTVVMGPASNDLSFTQQVQDDDAIFIPAGSWHNITNTGSTDLKLYSIYGPAEHPLGTVHATKAEADLAEAEHHGA